MYKKCRRTILETFPFTKYVVIVPSESGTYCLQSIPFGNYRRQIAAGRLETFVRFFCVFNGRVQIIIFNMYCYWEVGAVSLPIGCCYRVYRCCTLYTFEIQFANSVFLIRFKLFSITSVTGIGFSEEDSGFLSSGNAVTMSFVCSVVSMLPFGGTVRRPQMNSSRRLQTCVWIQWTEQLDSVVLQ